ncbi:MAG: hypothetical protein ABR909_07185 [Candidatus Bathyarchaeia archaeon]
MIIDLTENIYKATSYPYLTKQPSFLGHYSSLWELENARGLCNLLTAIATIALKPATSPLTNKKTVSTKL